MTPRWLCVFERHLTWRINDEAQCCIQLCAHAEEVKVALLAAGAVKMALLKTRQKHSPPNRSRAQSAQARPHSDHENKHPLS